MTPAAMSLIAQEGNKIQAKEKKILIWTFSVLVGAGIVFLAWYFIKKGKEARESKEQISDLKKEAKGITPTISESQAGTIATSIFEALNSYWVYESKVYNELRKINNIADWYLVNEKFDVKAISQNISTNLKQGNIIEWLNDRLDADEYEKVVQILASKNIKI